MNLAADPGLRDRLVRHVRRVCPSWLADQSEDLVQMCLVRLMRVPHAEVGETYLARVAYSVVVDEIRRRRRRNEVGMSPTLSERLVASGDVTPDMVARGNELSNVLSACLHELVEARRRAVVLYLQDHPVPEIARLLGWDEKKAKNAVYRGLDDLRAALAARGVHP